MVTLIALIHIVVCLFLVLLVLLQDPKSGGSSLLGAGSSNTVFGATGATTILTKMTRYSAIAFGITCLILAFANRPKQGSVLDTAAPATSSSTPATPEAAANANAAAPTQAAPPAAGTEQPAANPAAPAAAKPETEKK